MKIKLIILNIIILLFFVLCGTQENEFTDHFPGIEIPVMNGYYKLERVFDRPKYTKSLNYYIKVEYPAENVIEFYRSEFEKRGWKPDDFFTNQWMEVNTGIKQRSGSWINPELDLEIFLVLRYDIRDGKWDELQVICQIQPDVDHSKLMEFIDNFGKSNPDDYVKFIDLINKIPVKSWKLDIDKFNDVVKNNKTLEPYLFEYKKIANDIIKKTEEIIKRMNKKNL